MRTLLLVIHILAAGTWFGANVVQASINPRIRTYSPEIAAWWMRRTVVFGTRLYTPAALVSLITGVLLVIDGPYEFSAGFVSIGFAMVIVGAAFGMLVFGPRGRAVADAIERGDEAETQKIAASLARFGILDTVLLVTTVAVMVAKWGV